MTLTKWSRKFHCHITAHSFYSHSLHFIAAHTIVFYHSFIWEILNHHLQVHIHISSPSFCSPLHPFCLNLLAIFGPERFPLNHQHNTQRNALRYSSFTQFKCWDTPKTSKFTCEGCCVPFGEQTRSSKQESECE